MKKLMIVALGATLVLGAATQTPAANTAPGEPTKTTTVKKHRKLHKKAATKAVTTPATPTAPAAK